jgi:hypothetical protein
LKQPSNRTTHAKIKEIAARRRQRHISGFKGAIGHVAPQSSKNKIVSCSNIAHYLLVGAPIPYIKISTTDSGKVKLLMAQKKQYLFFSLINGKLFKITTLENYKGKLFDCIYVGMPEAELLEIEPSFIYDDFEEVYESGKGVFWKLTQRWKK